MRTVLIRVLVGVLAFLLGVAFASLCASKRQNVSKPRSYQNCFPVYDDGLVRSIIRENDDPDLFKAFQELPLYAMPDCIDEAYSLTWIPSFHEPVLVRIWRTGDQAFMIAKVLNTKGWAKFGTVEESHFRPLTHFEWREFTQLLNRAEYWRLPVTEKEMAPEDGAVWLLDGLKSKRYHWVRRRVPQDQYAEICKHVIRLSGLATAHALYLP